MIEKIRAEAAEAIQRFKGAAADPALLIRIRGLQDRIWKIKQRNVARDHGASAFVWVDNWDPPAGPGGAR